MLGLEHLVHSVFAEFSVIEEIGVRRRFFTDALTANENLGLEKALVLPRLALHVINGVTGFDVGIKAENHRPQSNLSGLREATARWEGPVRHALRRTFPTELPAHYCESNDCATYL